MTTKKVKDTKVDRKKERNRKSAAKAKTAKAVKKPTPLVAPKKAEKPVPPAPAPKPKKPRKKVERVATKIDWDAVRSRFVQGALPPGIVSRSDRPWPAQAEVAAEFGIGLSTLEQRCAAENWVGQRETFREELRVAEDKKRLKRMADGRVKRQVNQVQIADGLLARVAQGLRPDQPQRVMSSLELQRLASTARTAQQVSEVAQGKPADGPVGNADWTLFIVNVPAPPVQAAISVLDVEAEEIGGVVTPTRGA